MLKLFHNGPDANEAVAANLPVYCENYEEILFQDPTAQMRSLLIKKPVPYVSGEWKHHSDCMHSLSYFEKVGIPPEIQDEFFFS